MTEVDKAWEAYKVGPGAVHARRAMRKREFVAGWKAHVAYLAEMSLVAETEGAVVSEAILGYIQKGMSIHAIKQMRVDNDGMGLGQAKRIVDRIRTSGVSRT